MFQRNEMDVGVGILVEGFFGGLNFFCEMLVFINCFYLKILNFMHYSALQFLGGIILFLHESFSLV